MFFVNKQTLDSINCENSVAIINAPPNIIYRIIEEYKKWFKIVKTGAIKNFVFFIDYKSDYYTTEITKYLDKNHVLYLTYNVDNKKSLEQFSQFKNVLHFDFFKNQLFRMNNLDYIHTAFHNYLELFIQNNSNHTFVLPDYIFEPDNERIYNANDFSNYKGNERFILNYSLVSNLIDYYKRFYKMNLYKMILPRLIESSMNIFADVSYYCVTQIDNPYKKISRHVLDCEDFAGIINELMKRDLFNQDMVLAGKFRCTRSYLHTLSLKQDYTNLGKFRDLNKGIINLDTSFCDTIYSCKSYNQLVTSLFKISGQINRS